MSARGRHSSPRRSRTAGLLFTLAVAVVAGVCAGTYLGRHITIPNSTASRPGAPAHEALPAAPGRDPSSRAETRSAREPIQAPALHGPSEPGPTPDAGPARTQSPKPEVRQGSPRKRVRGYAGEIAHTDSGSMVALTFDAGASSKPTPDLLDALKSAGLHVTFFLTGKWCEQNEALVKRIHEDGHEIGNHTYSHPDLRKLSDDQIREQIAKVDEIVLRITGEHCAPYLRPPYGGRDKRIVRIASEAGYTPVYWSLDSWDSFKKGITSDEIRQRVLDRVQGGDIVLMHCGSRATADALAGLIRELRSRHLRIATVSELIRGG